MLVILGEGIQKHIIGENIQFITAAPQFDINFKSLVRIVRSQVRLKKAFIGVTIHLQVPLFHQIKTPLNISASTKNPNQDIDGGDAATHTAAFHVVKDRTDEIKTFGIAES